MVNSHARVGIVRIALLFAAFLSVQTAAAGPASQLSSTLPATRPAAFTFEPGQPDVSLPLARSRFALFVKASINDNKPGWFLLKTGNGQSSVATPLMSRLKLESVDWVHSQARSGAREYELVRLRTLTLGPLQVDRPLMINELPGKPGGSAPPEDFQGVLGMDVLGAAPFTIDWRACTLTIHNPTTFQPPAGAKELTACPCANIPAMTGEVEGHRGRFGIDSSYSIGLQLTARFADLNLENLSNRPMVSEGSPLGATPEMYVTRLDHVDLVGTASDDVQAALPDKREEQESMAGWVGNPWLRDSKLTIDTSGGRIWVQAPPAEPLDQLLKRLRDQFPTTAGAGGVAEPGRDFAKVTPLIYAAHLKRSDAVRSLLEQGADPNVVEDAGITPLMIAAGRGDDGSTAALLEHGAKTDARSNFDGYTPLVFAARYGQAKTIQILIDHKADINLASTSGRTPLYAAADARFSEAVRLLLDRGAIVDKATNEGATPLMAAGFNGGEASVKLLLEHKADPNASSDRGTPLTFAASSSRCVRLLLEAGADPNQVARNGSTPLATAAVSTARGATESARLLLAAGADPLKRTARKETPLDRALRSGSVATAKLLLDATEAAKGSSPSTNSPATTRAAE